MTKGDKVSFTFAKKTMEGVVEQVSEEELANMCALADRNGLYCCPQTGVALSVAQKLAAQHVIEANERVVVISTANGLKFSQMKTAYHAGGLKDIQAHYANAPIEIEADVRAVLRCL